MNRSIIISSFLHLVIIIITALSLPFLAKKPIDLPPIVSIELIQITDKTNIPFAPKAKKIIAKIKEKEKKLVSEQAPPKKVKKIKPDSVPMPEDKIKKVEKIKEDKQNPEKIDNEVKQVSEFEKKELFDPNNIAALIDKSKEESAEINKKIDKLTQDQQRNIENTGLSLSEEDALKAQIFGCWSIPGQGFYKVLAESALRAIKLCQPLRVPTTGYERWKELQLNFDAREMLEG